MNKDKIQYADDDHESIGLLLRLRVPSLFIGLGLGVVLSIITSSFEEVISKNVAIAFFIPFIVYLSDAVGTQTQSIYIRDLKTVGKPNFKIYLFKETILGVILGTVFSLLTALIVMVWFKSAELMWAISLSVFGAVASAPLIALVVTELFQIEHTDPAVGAGPIATIIQDAVSVVIYGFIASAILL
jgi:magnesium transporter